MLWKCDVWGWSGHIWETPRHNRALGNIDVIDKCRCGSVRSRKVFQPLPDMEPVESVESEHDGMGLSFDLIKGIIGLVIMIIIMTTLLPVLTETIAGMQP